MKTPWLIILLTTSIFAKNYQTQKNPENYAPDAGAVYERDPSLSCYDRNKEICYCDCVNPCSEVMPSAGPRVRDGANVYITGNFLYWSVREEGLEYVLRGVQTGTDPEVTSQDSIKSPSFRVEPGFKVGLGYQLPHDNWDLFLNYTWLKGKGVQDTTGTNMESLWFIPLLGDVIRAEADWHLMFNNFDFELGRTFYTSRYLVARPFAGLKGGWHDEDYKLRYLAELQASTEFVDRLHLDDFMWYLGLRLGCDTNWYFSKCWSLYGKSAISANWSYFTTDRLDQQFLPAQPNLRRTTLSSRNTRHTVIPVLELGIGIEWDTFFSDDDYHLAFALGWEEQIWWGHNYFVTEGQPQAQSGDLTMQGLNFKIRFDF